MAFYNVAQKAIQSLSGHVLLQLNALKRTKKCSKNNAYRPNLKWILGVLAVSLFDRYIKGTKTSVVLFHTMLPYDMLPTALSPV